MVYESCSDGIILLAYVGGIALYFLVGFLISVLVCEISKGIGENNRDFLMVLSFILWPIVIVVSAIYILGMWILFPLFGATREYVDRSEDRVNRRIYEQCSTAVDVSDDLDIFTPSTVFKVGDIITGIVPQTDKDGSNISYNHLYQGCKCRVLSIKPNGAMKVILIGHKDREAHIEAIGKTFNAPARNFTKVRKPAKKQKSAKKKTRK